MDPLPTNTPLLTSLSRPEVVVSGIQPSGSLHLGNYFGAIRQHIALGSDKSVRDEAYYFIVNYHALTSLHNRDDLKRYTLDVALDYLALGFDPAKAHLFVQSDVPQVTELAWILLCLTQKNRLELGVSYKDKVAQGLSPSAGLFTYPVLQAADILIYRGTLVPVGKDQEQHLEMTRDVAATFNREYETPFFASSRTHVLDEVAVVKGTDGRKMSKSYDNTIPIFAEGKELKERVAKIVTVTATREAPKDPDDDNVFALIRLFATEAEREEIAAAYRAGGYGHGDAKGALTGMIDREFGEARERRRELEARPDYVRDVLAAGAAVARAKAEATMEKVREIVGLANQLPPVRP